MNRKQLDNIAMLLSELMMRHTALEKTLIETGKLDVVLFEENLLAISMDVMKRIADHKTVDDKEMQ